MSSEPLVPDCRTAVPAASAGPGAILAPYPKTLCPVAVNALMPLGFFSVPFSPPYSQPFRSTQGIFSPNFEVLQVCDRVTQLPVLFT